MHIKNRSLILVLIAIALLSAVLPLTALAQTYTYSLPQQFIDLYINEDGTYSIDYLFIFVNDPSGPTIEFVDVGVPNDKYDLNSVVAFANGVELTDIEESPYVKPGVAVALGSQSIPAGQTGEVRVFIARVEDVLFPDDNDENYASARFSPNFFEGGSISGGTETILSYHFPPGVQPDEPRWHSAPSGFSSEPVGGVDDEGRMTYTWRNPSADATKQYHFGASFPRQYVPEGSIVTESSSAGTVSGGGFLTELVACASPFIVPLICFGGIAGLIIWGVTSNRRRKLKYLPPKISIEGHGIKRGLTAVEAGILMEEPMDKIMTMILFGTLKKNAATVISRDPLELELEDPLPDLRFYEKDFLLAFRKTKKRERRKALQKMMVELVKSMGKKMKGFSRKETVAYYKDITKRAWQQVEAADTPEVKSEKFDQHMEWTMLDEDYDDRTKEVFRTGPVFVPMWWPRYSPGYGRAATTTARPSVPSAGRPGTSMPTLPGSAFAGSIVTGVQSFSSDVVGSISDFTSGITNITNPPPKPSASSYSRGGGGGGGCACACACAGCACACAGGGR
jgi:hypothetical protein